MNQLTISEAVDLTGRSKRTLQRAMADKKLSFSLDTDGRKLLERSELERLYSNVTPMTEAVTPVLPHDKYDLIRLRRIHDRYDVALEGVYLDVEGEPTRIDTLDTFFYIEDAIEAWASLTKGAHWLDTYDRDDALLHNPEQYERVNMRGYDAVSVIRRGFHKQMVGAVKLDAADRIQRRYVYCQFDYLEGALAFARKLTGTCEIQVITQR